MKNTKVITVFTLLCLAAFPSCKKNYVCTCTTVVGAASTNIKHDIKSANIGQATESCNNYEDQANSTFPGGTTCHL